jgi:hypothetical protein
VKEDPGPRLFEPLTLAIRKLLHIADQGWLQMALVFSKHFFRFSGVLLG